jgi:uncharacterized protein YlxP (DUF503 family)
MTVGMLTLEIHLPVSRSLKDKRQALRSFQERVRNRLNVAIAEVGGQDLWQRATLVLVTVATLQDAVDRTFDSAIEEAHRVIPGEILGAEREYLG